MDVATKSSSNSFDDLAARRALAFADPNVLRMALYQATADAELARMRVIREPYWAGAYEVAALAPEHSETVREKALAFLRSGARSHCDVPDDETLRRLMGLMTDGAVNDFIFNFGKEELNFAPFPRGVEWSRGQPAALASSDFHVIIIGAGAAGLVAAIHLDRLGIPFTLIERNPEVGGTWWVNDYPDARVDVPSHHYQLTVTKKYPWQHWFATQPELLDYLGEVADEFDLRRKIRFNTELKNARWTDGTGRWEGLLVDADGKQTPFSANVIISAAGLFNAPNLPDIPGLDTFEGRIFHTTQWQHDYDYTGRRVGIIGVGCTGAQLMPAIARKAAHVDVFQRSPHWVARLDGYREPIPEDIQWLMDNIPHYWNWHCFKVFHTLHADDGSMQQIDPEWRANGGLINRRNDLLRENIRNNILAEFADDPAFARKLMPEWPPFARRLVVDNGWFDALKQPHVALVTEGIERITPRGVQTKDGVEHELDLIVVAGGFKAERYLWPVTYTGRNDVTLEQAWEADGARAYLGITLPDFPNLFVIYGPNTNPRAGGLFAWLEIWARYAVQCIAQMLERGHRTIECRREAYQAYNARVDGAQDGCIWAMDGLRSYYINEHGRQAINNPLRPSESYRLLREANLDDYHLG